MTIADGVVNAIFDHAREVLPHECCGLLIGTESRITAAIKARNLASDPTRRYFVDPHDHLEALRLARGRGEHVVGAYHSHPQSRAFPSATDAAEGFGQFLFVIAGLGANPPELTAWIWTDGNFTAVPLVRVP